jgi:hypothetical protein
MTKVLLLTVVGGEAILDEIVAPTMREEFTSVTMLSP